VSRILVDDQAVNVANVIVDALEEAGYEPEVAIPGLILAVTALAEVTNDPEQALDEAANLLADGPLPEEASFDYNPDK
jgi:CheY-like chemotaxis protein